MKLIPNAFASSAIALIPALAPATLLITEVLPGVNTTETNGDTVEIYNAGASAIDLTGYILTDLDPGTVESNILNEATFAPGFLSAPPLQPGNFAVIKFVDSTGGTPFSFMNTNYGIEIRAPLATGASSFLDVQFDQLVLADNTGLPIDSLAWGNSAGTLDATSEQDAREDLAALTLPTAAYGLTLGTASAWAGADSFADLAAYNAAAIDINGFTGVSTYGGGAIRRRSTNTTFDEASPDSPAQWEVVARERATLGNFSGPVATVDGRRLIRATGSIAEYIGNLRVTFFPERRISAATDQLPSDFKVPSLARQNDFAALVQKCLDAQWESANTDAAALGYELVQFRDTSTFNTFYILREIDFPGQTGFTGGGTYIFDPSISARQDLVIQVPHPIFDALTLEQSGRMIPLVRPRVVMIAGTHRNNSTLLTGCDGTFQNGDPYRISDVAHYTDTLFHATHKHLMAGLPATTRFIQLHGFCCSVDYGITEDVVISEGFNAAPAPSSLARLWKNEINAQNFLANGDEDLTEAGLYGDGLTVLGATNNIQGRLLNGVAIGTECTTAATGSTGRFIHIEQDLDVREEPDHIAIALSLALTGTEATVAPEQWMMMEE